VTQRAVQNPGRIAVSAQKPIIVAGSIDTGLVTLAGKIPAEAETVIGNDFQIHPGGKGANPFEVMEIVGNVWQWTDEYTDEHTRADIEREDTNYQPQGNIWCFPQAWRNNEYGKLLLMAPSYDAQARSVFDVL